MINSEIIRNLRAWYGLAGEFMPPQTQYVQTLGGLALITLETGIPAPSDYTQKRIHGPIWAPKTQVTAEVGHDYTFISLRLDNLAAEEWVNITRIRDAEYGSLVLGVMDSTGFEMTQSVDRDEDLAFVRNVLASTAQQFYVSIADEH